MTTQVKSLESSFARHLYSCKDVFNGLAMLLQCVHCPKGITEKDLKTFFAKVLNRSLEPELNAGLQLLRRHRDATLRDATLRIIGPWGGVCFVAGTGKNSFCIRPESSMYPIRGSLENLFLGFFRLLVAMAALLQGASIVLAVKEKSTFLFKGMSQSDFCLHLLYFVHLLLRLSVAVVVVLDTVYGSQMLLGTWPEYDVEEGKELDENLRNHVERKPMEEDGGKHAQEEKKQLAGIASWGSSEKTTRSLQNGDDLPSTRDVFWVDVDVVNDGAARCPTSSVRPSGQDGQTLSTLLPTSIRWLSRAGLYLTLASSGSGSKMAQGALAGPLPISGHCVVNIALEFSGFFMYTAGVVALLAAGLGVVFPRWLKTPWAREVAQGDRSWSVIRPDSNTNDRRQSALDARASRCCTRYIKHCETLSKLVCLLMTIVIGVVHVLRISSTASSTCLTTSVIKCWPERSESHLQTRSTFDSECCMSILPPVTSCLLPSLSAATLCAYVSSWTLANLVWDLKRRQLTKASRLFASLLYLCCLSTTWSRETDVVSGNVVTKAGQSEVNVSIAERYNQPTSPNNQLILSSSSTVNIVLSFLDSGLTTLILLAISVILPLSLSLISHFPVLRQMCQQTREAHKERQHPKCKSPSAKNEKQNEHRSRFVFFNLLQAVAMLVSFCGLGLVLMAFALPWVTVTTKAAPGISSVVHHLKNMSTQLEVNMAATDALLELSICTRDKVHVLSSELIRSRKSMAGIRVKEIASYCQSFVCQDTTHTVSSQRGENESHRVIFCAKFCYTLAFFQDKLEYSPLLHDPLARVVKGDNKTQDRFLKSVILKEKKRFLDELPPQSGRTRLREWLRSNEQGAIESGSVPLDPGRRHNLSANDENGNASLEEQEQVRELPQGEDGSTCMRTLCVLRSLSFAGLAAPLIGWMFQATFLAVEALVGLLKMVTRAEELSSVFSDFRVLVDSLALYLEHSQEERTVQFSITNYSLVYIAYPALLTGCIGILTGFWHRRRMPDCRRRRSAYAVVLPLLVLNVFGAVVAVFWTHIVESLVVFVALVQVTVSLESGGWILLAAFTCGACSCFMFLISAIGHAKLSNSQQQTVNSLLFDHQQSSRPESTHYQDSSHPLPRDERSEFTQAGPVSGHGQKGGIISSHQSSCSCGWYLGHSGDLGDSNLEATDPQKLCSLDMQDTRLSHSVKSQTFGDQLDGPTCPSDVTVVHIKKDSGLWANSHGRHSSLMMNFHRNKKIDRHPSICDVAEAGRPLPSGCRPWLLAVLLGCGGCGLMLACMRISVFHVCIDLRKDFQVLLARLEQSGTAVEIGRHVLSQEDVACGIMEALGREILLHYLSTLQEIDFRPLRHALKELEAKMKNDVDTTLPFITIPCLVTLAAASALVVYGAVAAKLLAPRSRWFLRMSAASSGTRRLALLSLAWFLHASLALTGPAANAATPDVVDLHVHLTPGFGLVIAAHVIVLLAALELHLTKFSPLI